jgi:thiol:disulfide interchange protein DsbA
MERYKHRILAALLPLALAACGGGVDDAETSAADPPVVTEDVNPSTQPADEPGATAAASAPATGDEAVPTAGRFELGRHYERLSPTQPTSSNPEQIEVAEVFWYGCPHCFDLDAYLERWESSKPEYVNFVRVPAVWNPLLQTHARAFYTAEALGKGEEMHEEFFREIHERNNYLDTEEKLQAFFARFGVDAAAFKTAFDSFAVHAKLQRADELNRRYRIASVPTMIVNGKYTTDGGMAGSYDALIDLVDELATAEREAR